MTTNREGVQSPSLATRSPAGVPGGGCRARLPRSEAVQGRLADAAAPGSSAALAAEGRSPGGRWSLLQPQRGRPRSQRAPLSADQAAFVCPLCCLRRPPTRPGTAAGAAESDPTRCRPRVEHASSPAALPGHRDACGSVHAAIGASICGTHRLQPCDAGAVRSGVRCAVMCGHGCALQGASAACALVAVGQRTAGPVVASRHAASGQQMMGRCCGLAAPRDRLPVSGCITGWAGSSPRARFRFSPRGLPRGCSHGVRRWHRQLAGTCGWRRVGAACARPLRSGAPAQRCASISGSWGKEVSGSSTKTRRGFDTCVALRARTRAPAEGCRPQRWRSCSRAAAMLMRPLQVKVVIS
jgi:hypothetical protein